MHVRECTSYEFIGICAPFFVKLLQTREPIRVYRAVGYVSSGFDIRSSNRAILYYLICFFKIEVVEFIKPSPRYF